MGRNEVFVRIKLPRTSLCREGWGKMVEKQEGFRQGGVSEGTQVFRLTESYMALPEVVEIN